tara:strand:+ start:1598 stop:1999 length:402 start_codon:yes stop_codon:yes gene_type:complete
MSDLNVVVVAGRLVSTPKYRETTSGHSVCDVALACNRRKNDEVDFVEVTFWGKTAETASNHLDKGRFITVTGRLKQERWETEEGQKRSKLSVTGDSFNFVPDGSSKNSKKTEDTETSTETSTETAPEAEVVPF